MAWITLVIAFPKSDSICMHSYLKLVTGVWKGRLSSWWWWWWYYDENTV